MSRVRPPRSRQARARIALALCVLWIAGFELLPWMHVALHDQLAAHHHAADGSIVLGADRHHDDRDTEIDEHAADHDRDGEVDEHAVDHAKHAANHDDRDGEVDEHADPHPDSHVATAKGATRDRRAHLADALAHGEHSLAHHGVAVPAPAPVITQPLPVDRRPSFAQAIVGRALVSQPAPRASARGPPARSFGSS